MADAATKAVLSDAEQVGAKNGALSESVGAKSDGVAKGQPGLCSEKMESRPHEKGLCQHVVLWQ